MHRRNYLVLAGTTTTAALAGCIGGDDSENGGENGDENGDDNTSENGGDNTTENGDDNTTENGDDNTTENGDENGTESAAFALRNVLAQTRELEVGETFTVTSTLENTGNATGMETIELYVGDERVDERIVELPPGESTTVTFDGIDTSGLATGSVPFSVVTETAGGSGGTLTIMEASESSPIQFSNVTPADLTFGVDEEPDISVDVQNTGDSTFMEGVTLTDQGGLAATRAVTLDPGETQTVTFQAVSMDFLGEGEHTLSIEAGNASTEIAVTVESGNGGEEPSDGPISAIERYYELLRDAQEVETPEEFLDILRPILHSESPLIDLVEQAEGGEDPEDTGPTDTSNAERRVVGRNLSATDLSEEYGITALPGIEESDLDVIAGDNVIIEEDLNADPSDNVERTNLFFLTQENGEWVIFITFGNETRTSGS
jgi:hypothetical protein